MATLKLPSLAAVERVLWFALMATLGWQLRIVLWQADTVFWEWRSMSVWSSDILMAVLFVSALWQGWRPRVRGYDWLLVFLVAASILSLGNADDLTVGIYAIGRLVQYIILFLYVRQWAAHRFDAAASAAVFVAGAMLQAALGIAQYALRHDLGLRRIGEPLLSTDMRGVAVFFDGAQEKILRAYGTSPHPNVLATLLMVATWALAWLYARHGSADRKEGGVWAVAGALLLWGMFLTFSRTMIAAWAGATAVIAVAALVPRISGRWPNIGVVRRRLLHALAVAIVAGAAFVACFHGAIWARLTVHASDEAVSLRVQYARDALTSGGGSSLHINWTGVGIGNFTSWLRRYDPSLPRFMQQPAHNIYLLAYAELGLVGSAIWFSWLVSVVLRTWRSHTAQPLIRTGMLAMLGAFLFIGMFDHFFWTLEPGHLLWWLGLAIAAGPAGTYDEPSWKTARTS